MLTLIHYAYRSLATSQLAVLNLDYNRQVEKGERGIYESLRRDRLQCHCRFSQPDVSSLCTGLHSCQTLHSISLDYCHLDAHCADPLGTLATATQIKYKSLSYIHNKTSGIILLRYTLISILHDIGICL